MALKVKICGLTNLADAQAALAAGADMLGFIFFTKSPRYASPERVREIVQGLGLDRRQTVGVFVNESSAAVAQILDFCGLDLAQLHGEEPPEMVTGDLHGRSYKALRPRSLGEALDLASRYALPASLRGEDRRPALLVDAYHPHLRGGTGETGDWSLAAALAGQYPLLLAGGLCPANVAEAVRAVRPWGVDVSSGIESAPGQKDHAAIRAFIAAAKAISSQPSAADNQWNGVHIWYHPQPPRAENSAPTAASLCRKS